LGDNHDLSGQSRRKQGMKAIFHYDAGPRLAARFAALADEGFVIAPCLEADEARLAVLLSDAEVLLHVLKPATKGIIDQAPKLRLIQKIGIGANTIDLTAARARGIAVANMPGTNTPAIARTTLLLILAALRNIAGFDRACRAEQGRAQGDGLQDRIGELRGRTVGLVGGGMVPRALVPILRGCGAEIVYWSRSEHPELGVPRCELAELLTAADIVSLHLPLVPETERLIDRAALARMKPGAILVNTARGELVDEAALVEALTKGCLRAAGLDVFAEESLPAGNPLLALDNVVLIPNVAWLTPGMLDRNLDAAVGNMRRLRDGRELLFRVV
jgi:phosphoglycerate dehydrogenase-like enzyme